MNAPEKYELFTLPEGSKKVEYQEETKIQNTGTFIIRLEDHTLGNIIRVQLIKDSNILFAGYRVPHPFEYQVNIKIRTDGKKEPKAALRDACVTLSKQLEEGMRKFEDSLDKFINT